MISWLGQYLAGKVNDFPLSFYERVQQLGRLDCGEMAPPGSNMYEIHVGFFSYVLLFVHIMQQEVPSRHKLELEQIQ